MPRGRKPLPDSYICNLNDITFAIACREHPSNGTQVEVVIPIKHSVTYEQMDNMIFLLDKEIYQTVPPNIYKEVEPLRHSEMRRNFYIYDTFPSGTHNERWEFDTLEVTAPEAEAPVYLPYYWRTFEERSSESI